MSRFKIVNSTYVTSAVNHEGWIIDDLNEICFVGRSNVGKSSFINTILNRKRLVKVAAKPGKTRMLNFFSINNDAFRIVDAPGYGYSQINHKQKRDFAALMEDYLSKRKNLKCVCMLVDLRHPPSKDDILMKSFLDHYDIPTIIIGSKLDKLRKNDISKNQKIIKQILPINKDNIFIKTSSLKKQGILEFWDEVAKFIC